MNAHTFKDYALRAVALLGLLAILLLGAWGIIQVAFFISSLFTHPTTTTDVSAAREIMTLSVPASATSGQSLTISWKHQNTSGNYSYAVSYSCVDGVTFKAPVPTGDAQSVPCNTPFNYTQATESITLTPVYSGSADAKVTMVVTATKLSTGAVTASASGATTIAGTNKATATAKPATTKTTSTAKSGTTYFASGRTNNLYGYADLAVYITSVYSSGGNTRVTFTIQNDGTNVAPAGWSFTANAQAFGSYPSGSQRALYPGDKIVYTLNYSDYPYNSYGTNNGYTYGTCNLYGPCAVPGYYGGYTPAYNPYSTNSFYMGPQVVSIQVDPYGHISDLNRANNGASATYTNY